MRIKRRAPYTRCTDNLADTPDAAAPGTAFTYGAANADGTEVQVLDNLAHDVNYLVIGISGSQVSGEDSSALVDLLIDRSGGTTWVSFIDDLIAGFHPPLINTVSIANWYHFPVRVPAGAALAVRGRRNGASTGQGHMVIYAYQWPDIPWSGEAVESLGINAATSKGTAHTPGASGSFSAFATIGTSTRRYGALQLGINGSDDVMIARGWNWEIGVGGARLPGSPRLYAATTTTEIMTRCGFVQPIWCDIAAGTAIQVRACSSGTSEDHTVGLYGVY